MKRYKHKITGRIVGTHGDGYVAINLINENTLLPRWIIENTYDWEEIKEEPEVPKGIKAFIYSDGSIETWHERGIYFGYDYSLWVKANTGENKYGNPSIHTIFVNNIEWSVGEDFIFRGFKHKVTSFKWETSPCNHWMLMDGSSQYNPEYSEKIPDRKPIATLQGKNLFIGDKYYTVTDLFKINEFIINEPDGTWYYQFDEESRSFHSKELAEDYIKENKPVYPYEMVKYLMERAEDVYRQPKNIYALRNMNDAVKQLKTYKPTS